MKTIEEIEKMCLEEMETIAEDNSIATPPLLAERLQTSLSACGYIREEAKSRHKKYAFAASVAVAAALAGILMIPRQPKETFSDPTLAYAELEKRFAYISRKIDRGMEIAAAAEPVIVKTTEVFNKPNKK